MKKAQNVISVEFSSLIPCVLCFIFKDNCGGQPNRFQCANKECTFGDIACDGFKECNDGSDEAEGLCSSEF